MADPRRRPVAIWIVAGVFLLLSLNALVQVAMHLMSMNTDPVALALLQLLTGSAALAAAVTTWRRSGSAWIWALVYGATALLLLGSLGPILDLESDEVRGIWIGGGVLAALSVVASWYLRHKTRPNVREEHVEL